MPKSRHWIHCNSDPAKRLSSMQAGRFTSKALLHLQESMLVSKKKSVKVLKITMKAMK